MSALDPRIEKIRAEYDLDKSDFWELPQKRGTWLVKHSALETVAAKAKITFDMPEIVERDTMQKVVAIVVRGFMGDRSEWSFGEASPANNKNAYVYAMAEKRGKDRVILKLAGIHGLVYSEDEFKDVDEPPRQQGTRPNGTKSSAQIKREADLPDGWNTFVREIGEAGTISALDKLRLEWSRIAVKDGWNATVMDAAKEVVEQQREYILNGVDRTSNLHMAG